MDTDDGNRNQILLSQRSRVVAFSREGMNLKVVTVLLFCQHYWVGHIPAVEHCVAKTMEQVKPINMILLFGKRGLIYLGFGHPLALLK